MGLPCRQPMLLCEGVRAERRAHDPNHEKEDEAMQEYGMAPMYEPRQSAPPVQRRRGRRWLLLGGIALAFALTLGLGALLGTAFLRTAQAANLPPGSGPFARHGFAGTPGAQGQPGQPGQPCDVLTVTSVSGQTIVAKAQDGSTVTIHTSASTHFTKAGQAASASAVTVGSTIHVRGTHNSDGSITATDIDVE